MVRVLFYSRNVERDIWSKITDDRSAQRQFDFTPCVINYDLRQRPRPRFVWAPCCSETRTDLATSSDSKVSGFDRPHVPEKVSDSKVSTLESGFKSFHSGEQIQKFPDSQVGFTGCVRSKDVSGKKSLQIQNYPDTCGRGQTS